MSAKHTPGPWTRRSIPGHLFELYTDAGDPILRIRGGMMPSLEDARVLEAAPELLEVARLVAALTCRDGAGPIGICPTCEAIREAAALLARVRGED